MKYIFTLVLGFIIAINLSAQYQYQPVLKGLTGNQLLTQLALDYKPPVVFDYGTARDTLFFRAFRKNDSLECFYSGHEVALPEGSDPTTIVYQNGQVTGINTEHAYPQSKGAVGGAKSDMNILYPVKIPVNEARGNLPYGEIPDNTTQKWYYKNLELTSIPSQKKDLYSEVSANAFEPRESVKGDVARAVFYFYTMYKAEADAADPDFFNGMKNTLCQWHLLDPNDEDEWKRSHIIGSYQGNKVNPFVLDCTLANRCYCPNYPPTCDTSKTSSLTDIDVLRDWKLSPNPFGTEISIDLNTNSNGILEVYIHSLIGQLIFHANVPYTNGKLNLSNAQLPQMADGNYFISIHEDQKMIYQVKLLAKIN